MEPEEYNSVELSRQGSKGSFVRRRSNGLRKRSNGQSRVYWRHTEACLYRELG